MRTARKQKKKHDPVILDLERKECEMLELRHKERDENMNPPDDSPFRKLACAVIFQTIKMWHGTDPKKNRFVVEFLRSDDYVFWSEIAGIRVDGEDIIHQLSKNGGLHKTDMLYVI